MKTILNILIIFLAIHLKSYAQTNTLDWGAITLSGYSQTEILPTGEFATITYGSTNNNSYQTSVNIAQFSFGPTNASCDGISNSGPTNASGIYIEDDYNSNYPDGNGSTAAVDGKDWNISFSSPLTDVNFDIYDLSSVIHSTTYPDANIGVYNDKVTIKGKDNNGNDIYPTLTNIGTTFLQGLDNIVSDCTIIGGTYEGQGYAGDVDFQEFVVDNTSTPPMAYTAAGTINSASGDDSDCFSGGFFYSMDINVDFGSQIVSEITVTYHNQNNGLLGSQDALGTSCVQVFTGMQPQAIFLADILYSVAVLPIELVSFEGKADNKDNHLKWTTASEVNNDYFSIMHSLDGKIFDEIGSLKGEGNSSRLITYDYVHKNAPSGRNYYRLDQYDLDGTSSSSEIITILRDYSNLISVFPTVSQGNYMIQGMRKKSTVEIFSLNGKLQKTLHASQEFLDLDISALSTGVYIVKITSPAGSQTFRVFKE